MTKTTMNLAELLEKHDDGDFLRAVAEAVLQLLMETDVEGVIGAGRHERADGRTTWRNHCPAGECLHSPRGATAIGRWTPGSGR